MPGMGGTDNNRNFILNCTGWEQIRTAAQKTGTPIVFPEIPKDRTVIRIAPVTGAVENIGFANEQEFYSDYLFAAYKANIGLSVGDGYPDIKLQSGIGAVKLIQKNDSSVRAAVFIKPYTNEKILERVAWAEGTAEIIGIDIDSYAIVTMRNLVQLEKKTAAQLLAIKKTVPVPFALKGIFSRDDIELLKEVKPDIAIVSNHGGRIRTRTGSTAEFLSDYASEIQKFCGELWVDGGIRTSADIRTALALGAKQVMIGRPFIAALCHGGTAEFIKKADEFRI
jgi:isopentenyl diphosphate isomerase/L-lactate dehydrogenase-like FMN-dependent dehydrogenase